ncbi:hypothetical protein ACH3O9_02215 [Leeuwenhoekiella sp. A16]|uniref:hypothetical protein n=1 Tax=unclassified Leeuwenhoekiella TaxID=2615029 RepID=UPI003A8058A9
MKAASVAIIKKDLKHRSQEELVELVLRLSKFKKENKELLTYLLFEADHEEGYIEIIKSEINDQFSAITSKNYYYIKKSIRKILRETKKYIRYSGNKETEVILLLHFCEKLQEFKPSISRNTTLKNLYDRQLDLINRRIAALHEDLQYDYLRELEALN